MPEAQCGAAFQKQPVWDHAPKTNKQANNNTTKTKTRDETKILGPLICAIWICLHQKAICRHWLHNCRLNGVDESCRETSCAGCYRPQEHPCTRMSGQGLGQVLGPSSSIMDIFVSRKNNREWATIMSPRFDYSHTWLKCLLSESFKSQI